MTRSTVASHLAAWTRAEADATPLRIFRIAFGLVWLLYDVLDVCYGGTRAAWSGGGLFDRPQSGLLAVQAAAIALDLALIAGRRLRLIAASAALLRMVEASLFVPRNEFFYFAVTALILSQSQADASRGGADAPARIPRWPYDVLRWQIAWIYFASALLKLNPAWLDGGHLYVRHAYMADFYAWPYPEFVSRCVASLPCDRVLARIAIGGEFAVATLVTLGRARAALLFLALCIHGYAALALNVWFFGAAMLAHLALVTRIPPTA